MTIRKFEMNIRGSYPYNRNMAQALYRSTFLESWGSGIHRIIEACREQGVEDPTWRWDGGFVYVTFKRSKQNTVSGITSSETVNDTAKLILKTIAENPRITYKEIVKRTSISRAMVTRAIAKLSSSGYLIRHGADKNGYWEGYDFKSKVKDNGKKEKEIE